MDILAKGDIEGGQEEEGDEMVLIARGEGVESFGGRGGSEGGVIDWCSTGEREEDLAGGSIVEFGNKLDIDLVKVFSSSPCSSSRLLWSSSSSSRCSSRGLNCFIQSC